MEKWQEMKYCINQQIILLRQNKDETNKDELIGKLSNNVKEFLGDTIDENNSATIEECLRRLHDLLDAYSSRDIVFLADVLEYEILDMIEWIEDNYR